ncbi:MAG: hypothetical protein UY09_C0021G0001, partial [Parcubacteria group bacterium GW2011_GWA2_47_8]
MLQVGGKNSLGLFRKMEFVECALDFGLIAAMGMVFKADSDGLAIGCQRLESKMPESSLG